MPELTRLDGLVDRINVDNADSVLYLMLENSREKHVLRIPMNCPQRVTLNLTKAGDNVTVGVDEQGFVRQFTNVELDD